MNMLKNVKFTTLYAGSTAAATDVDSTVLVDMSGFEGCMIVASAVKSTAGGTTGMLQLVPRHSATNTSTTGITDLGSTSYASDTAFSTGDVGKAFIVDIYRPTKRYVTATVNRTGANDLALGTVYAIQYGAKKAPITQASAQVGSSKQLVSPTT